MYDGHMIFTVTLLTVLLVWWAGDFISAGFADTHYYRLWTVRRLRTGTVALVRARVYRGRHR